MMSIKKHLLAAAALSVVASQASAVSVSVWVQDFTLTSGAFNGALLLPGDVGATSFAVYEVGTGDFSVSGTGIGDASLDSGYFQDVTFTARTSFAPGLYSDSWQSWRVNFSDPLTSAAGPFVGTSSSFFDAGCDPLSPGAFACPNTPTGTDLATTFADDGLGGPDTVTIAFTSFISATDFSGTITTFQDTVDPDRTTETVWAFSTASPVPVPAAAWLFGSALLGLVGIGRKRRG